MPKGWEEILQNEYETLGDEGDDESPEIPEDSFPEDMAQLRLGGVYYHLFVAEPYRPDLPLLLQDEWTPEETQRLHRLFTHLKTRKIVISMGQRAREEFLRDLKVREQTCAEVLRKRLQESVEEYL